MILRQQDEEPHAQSTRVSLIPWPQSRSCCIQHRGWHYEVTFYFYSILCCFFFVRQEEEDEQKCAPVPTANGRPNYYFSLSSSSETRLAGCAWTREKKKK